MSALALALAAASLAAASPWEAFREGKPEEALAAVESLTREENAAPETSAQAALLLRDLGRDDEALAYWKRATASPDADGFVWSQRAWCELGREGPKRARESFSRAVERSASTASQAEAQLGLGLASLLAGKPKEALPPLRNAQVQGPYAMPLASHQTGLAAIALGNRRAAETFLRQSVSLDPYSLEALRDLASLEEKLGDKSAARRLYERLLVFEPGDKEGTRRLEKLHVPERGPIGARRLMHPLLGVSDRPFPSLPRPGPDVRVALFSDREGSPAVVKRLTLVANAPFRVESAPGRAVADGAGGEPWELSLREDGAAELRDSARNIRHTSTGPFRLVALPKQGSFLIKDASFETAVGRDPGDRELRGVLEVRPSSGGLRLVNELPLEEYLLGVVGGTLPSGSPADAYRAVAVVARTRALFLRARARAASPPAEADLCDSPRCQRYLGASAEMREASSAVAVTAGTVLAADDAPAEVFSHESCGGLTEGGDEAKGVAGGPVAHLRAVADGPLGGELPESPSALERWTHAFPPKDSYCEASTLNPPAQSRWLRLLAPDDLRRRAARLKDIGAVRALRVLKRSRTGRVLALEAVGDKGSLPLEGYEALSDFLSPGSLRSTLFTIQPLRSGRRLSGFLLWGAGTGHGLGLCQAGAIGQAQQGRDWREILKHYFPELLLKEASGHGAR